LQEIIFWFKKINHDIVVHKRYTIIIIMIIITVVMSICENVFGIQIWDECAKETSWDSSNASAMQQQCSSNAAAMQQQCSRNAPVESQ